jgi:hypothetical protein
LFAESQNWTQKFVVGDSTTKFYWQHMAVWLPVIACFMDLCSGSSLLLVFDIPQIFLLRQEVCVYDLFETRVQFVCCLLFWSVFRFSGVLLFNVLKVNTRVSGCLNLAFYINQKMD